MYLSYGIPRATRNIWKNWQATLNSVLIVAAALSLMGMIGLLYVNTIHLSKIWLSNSTVSLFLQEGMKATDREKLLAQVQQHPMVRNVMLISPQDGLRSLATKLGSSKTALFDAEQKGIPFTIDFEVFVDYRKNLSSIAEKFGKLDGVVDVIYAERVLDKTLVFFKIMKGLGLFFMVLLLLAFCLIIANATRLSLYARRQEIEILHMAGATRGFIRSAFVVEGMMIGLIGWWISITTIWVSFSLLVAGLTWNALTANLKELSIFFSWQTLATSLLVIILLGGVSSHLSVSRMLREMEP